MRGGERERKRERELFTSCREEVLAGSGEASRALTVDRANSKLVPPMGSDVLQHRALFHGLGEKDFH